MRFLQTFFKKLQARNTDESPNEKKIDPVIVPQSIVVLPFKKTDRDDDENYLLRGITEDLINSLSTIPNLEIIARNSVLAVKKEEDIHEIIQKVSIKKALDGIVFFDQDALRLNIELKNINTNSIIWEKEYSSTPDQFFSMVENIVIDIVRQLNLGDIKINLNQVLSHATNSFELYNLYLKGRYFFNLREKYLYSGIEVFEKVIQLNPEFAPAYAGLSQCYVLLGFYNYESPEVIYPKAKNAALQSISLNSRASDQV